MPVVAGQRASSASSIRDKAEGCEASCANAVVSSAWTRKTARKLVKRIVTFILDISVVDTGRGARSSCPSLRWARHQFDRIVAFQHLQREHFFERPQRAHHIGAEHSTGEWQFAQSGVVDENALAMIA